MPLLIPADYDPLADMLATPTPAPMSEAMPMPASDGEAAPVESAAGSISVAPPTPAPAPSASRDEGVLQALLDGLGLPDLRTSREPRDLARLVGEMLREAVGGTMEILLARAMTKRDSHIDMTMIGARSNSPLKFFPDPQSALSQMLNADTPAYLPGVNALAAAFDDLKAHELAVIVGMRAALAEVVQRFEPARIEQRLAAPGRLDKLMPSARKARLWDLLTGLYADLVRDGDEDVQRIFGEKFALAYLEQIARLRAAR
jgi:FHA domain-containing protein/type VI secretion system protein